MLQWIKTHPLYDVLLAVGLFIVFYLIARSGSSGGGGGGGVTYVQSGPSDAVQTAQLAASTQAAHDQASLTATAQNTQASLALGEAALTEKAIEANLGAGVAHDQIGGQVQMSDFAAQVQQNIAMASAQAQVAINADQVSGSVAINSAQVAGQVAIAGYSAQTAIQTNHENNLTQRAIADAQLNGLKYQIDGSVAMNDSNNAALVARDQIAGNTTVAVTGINAGVQVAGINAARDVNLADIGSKTTLGLADTSYKQTVSLADIAAGVTVAGYQKDLYSQALTNEADKNTQDFNAHQYDTSSWMNYVTQLTQLKAYGKDISGLPGTGNTPQLVSAAQPSQAAQIMTSIGNMAAGIGKGLGFAFA